MSLPIFAAASAAQYVFVADRAYTLAGVREIHGTASTSGTFALRKIQVDGQAPSAAAGANVIELLAGTTASLAGTANTVLVPNIAVSSISKGDRIAINFGGTMTNLALCMIQLELEAA